jgi:hypothetical protein
MSGEVLATYYFHSCVYTYFLIVVVRFVESSADVFPAVSHLATGCEHH